VRFSLLSTFGYVAIGMIVSIMHVSWDQLRPSWLRGRIASSDLWFLIAVPIWFVVALVPEYKAEPVVGVASFFVLGAVMFPLGGARRMTRLLEQRVLAGLGVASLSLYVWHEPVIRFVTDDQKNFLHDHLLLQLLVVLTGSIIVAVLSYRFIETPALKRRRRWEGGRTTRAGEADRQAAAHEGGPVPVTAEQAATGR
jgi:peptidoglycan/LPS O-acetylase OafA/YrhL